MSHSVSLFIVFLGLIVLGYQKVSLWGKVTQTKASSSTYTLRSILPWCYRNP